jgi:hypothetical protein
MDLGGYAARIVVRQASDQLTYLLRDPRPTAVRAGTPAPIETEAGTVPSDGGLGLDDDENLTLARPKEAKGAVQNKRLPTCKDGRGRLRFSTASC